MASGFSLTVMNYFLIGWFNGYLDKYYMESWKSMNNSDQALVFETNTGLVLIAIYVVFVFFGNVSLAVVRSRLGEKGFLAALLENFKWTAMMIVFFGGLSFHLSLAILAHMFSVDMQWSITAKEKSNSNFFKEIPKIFKTFRWMYAVMLPLICGMIYLGCFRANGLGNHAHDSCGSYVNWGVDACITADFAQSVSDDFQLLNSLSLPCSRYILGYARSLYTLVQQRRNTR